MASSNFDPNPYWEQRLSDQYTLGSVGWSGLGESFNRWMYAVRRHVFERCATDALDDRSSLRVLDIGSGTGFYIDGWRRLGVRDISGSDFTSTAVERLRMRFPEAVIHAFDIGGESAQLPEETYDAISIIDVLYHIVDEERYVRALTNLARLLKPNGVLILSENFVDRPQSGPYQVSRPGALITNALSDAGLEPFLLRPMFVLMNAPVDSDNRLLRAWWERLVATVSRREVFGWSVGALVFPVELALVRLSRRGPSSKIMACRRQR